MPNAIRFAAYGGPEVLELVPIDLPEPAAGEVVVEVRAAGVNPVDWKVRRGARATESLTVPRGLGSDAAGVVLAVGDAVSGLRVGDPVIARGLTGAYASHVVTTPEHLTAKPDALGWEQAASLGVPAGTAYQVLTSLGLVAGDRLLLHAGSGAVGQAAIQLARHWGASVVATASEPNHARLVELGATPVAYGPGLVDRLRAAAPGGFTVVFDAAGTDEAIDVSLELVADRSRIATIVDVERAERDGFRAWSGSRPGLLGPTEQRFRAEAVPFVANLASRGRFSIEIAARYALAEAADAHRRSETGHVRGKIVLLP